MAIENKKLKSSMALLKKQKEAQRIARREKKKKDAASKARKLALLKEQKRKEELSRLALKKEREEELVRLALEKEKRERESLIFLKQENPLYTAKFERDEKEIEQFHELELMNVLENEDDISDGLVNEGLALFLESEREEAKNKKNKKGKKSKKGNFWTDAGFKDPSKWLNVNLSYSTKVDNLHNDNSGREILKSSLSFSPYKGVYFSTTMMKDINSYESKAYQPDFVYSFGYSNHPWSINYDNYSNNKFDGPGTQKRYHFDQGAVRLKYKTKVKDWPLSIAVKQNLSNETRKFYLSTNKKLFDKVLFSAQFKHYFAYPQQQLTLSAKTFLYEKFFVSSSVYLYSHHKDQVPFEPDYAYSFGWKDSRPFYPSIVYSNYYTPTRWSNRSREGSDFEDGGLSVSFKLKF